MMVFFEFYIVFCIATGITSYFTLFKPLISEMKKRNLNTDCINKVYYAVSTCSIIALKAPFVFLVVLKGADEEFLNNVIESICSDE
jgi:hypothetical protein